MSWLAVIMVCAAGMYLLDDRKEGDVKTNETVKEYSKGYCREHLSAAYYDNWECERIARQIREDYRIKDELEYLLKSGYSFERAVDDLVRTDKINLKKDYIVSIY